MRREGTTNCQLPTANCQLRTATCELGGSEGSSSRFAARSLYYLLTRSTACSSCVYASADSSLNGTSL
jgi:hypothetical protein